MKYPHLKLEVESNVLICMVRKGTSNVTTTHAQDTVEEIGHVSVNALLSVDLEHSQGNTSYLKTWPLVANTAEH